MTNDSQDIVNKELMSFIKEKWFSRRGLLALLILELLFLLPYLWKNFGLGLSIYEWIIVFLVISITILCWLVNRRYPRNAHDRIGVIVAVTTESNKEYIKLKSDLILRVKEVIRTKRRENIFNIIEFPEYHASKIQDYSSSAKALEKARAHFIIYGTCKRRLKEGKYHYFITLEATVVHKPIPKITSDKLAREFAELFPRRLLFPIADEISGFEITKEWVGLVSRYIIGIAAFLSGDFDLSFELFRELHVECKKIDADIIQIKKIKTRIPQRISESAMALAARKYFAYRKTKNKKLLYEIKPLLDILKAIDPNNYRAHLLRAIYLFLIKKNVEEAKKEIRKSKSAVDATWRYNEAFLYAYEKDLEKTEKSYKKAFKCVVTADVLFQTEEFMNDVLEVEPNQCQLWYCLGMINWFAKEDKALGKECFERFLKCGSDTDFSEQKRKVKQYLKQL